MVQVSDVLALHAEVQRLYHTVYQKMSELSGQLRPGKMPCGDMVDIGYLLREMENILDELRKEVKARKELTGKLIAFERVQAFVEDSSIDMTVRGSLASGTPDVKQLPELPKKGTPEYGQLLAYFGATEAQIQQGALKPDFKVIAELCTQRAADGLPNPPGIGKTFPSYETVYRKCK